MVQVPQHLARSLHFIHADERVTFPAETNAEQPEFLQLTTANLKHYRQYLGREFSAVVIDCSESLHADALVALAGCVRAGGSLILRLPKTLTPALTRFIDDAAQFFAPANLVQSPQLRTLPTTPFVLTAEQQSALQTLLGLLNSSSAKPPNNAASESASNAIIIQATRGRGKSTLLGLWMASAPVCVEFVLCAPSRQQASSVFRHLGERSIQFVAPDQLLNSDVTAHSWLVIDEAASLPAHVLTAACTRFSNVVFASTTEGYESAGRGFVLKFLKQLPALFEHVVKVSLEQPVRWGHNDPLERWINYSFGLYAADSTTRLVTPVPAHNLPTLHYRHVHAAELTHAELDDAFQLLMAAHYQTSPNDLKILLDDRDQWLLLQYTQIQPHDQQLIGVCWLCTEGPIPAELHEPILAGRRRPPGALIPQLLAYGLRITEALHQPTLRIVRIAVRDDLQNHGFGSLLLQQVAKHYPEHLRGTSFGFSPELDKFWRQNNYHPVRLGSHIDAASGLPSAVYVAPTSISSNSLAHALKVAHCILQRTLPFVPIIQRQQRLSSEQFAAELDKTDCDEQEIYQVMHTRLTAFSVGAIPFDYIQPITAYLFAQKRLKGPADDCELLQQVNSHTDLASAAKALGFTGKKALEQHLRTVCRRLHLEL